MKAVRTALAREPMRTMLYTAAPVAGAGYTHPLTLKAWAALAQAVRTNDKR